MITTDNNYNNWKTLIVCFLIGAVVGLILHFIYKPSSITPPVEGNIIDSIIKKNDKLIIEAAHLDSIKNAKVIEVKGFDNDSTLNLFYQLIGK